MVYIKLEDLQKFPIRIDNYDKANGHESFINGVETVLEYAEHLPTMEVKHGEWKWKFNLDGDDFFECSVCGRQEIINGLCRERNPVEHFPYCHCGAKMDGGSK